MAPAKAKGQKMALGDFLTDASLGSWADEMEDMPMPSGMNPLTCARLARTARDVFRFFRTQLSLTASGGRTGYGGDRSFSSTSGYGNGFADRGGYSVREQLPLPSKPPYTAHLGNMSFDATEGDITDFFTGCSVTHVRIVEDKMDRKPKGFGYVEFATLDGLKKALDSNGVQFQGRSIRVSVAEPQKDRPDAREFGDWTRKGPLPDISGQRKPSERGGFAERGGFGSRNYDNVSEAGSDRGDRRRPAYEQGDGKVRDFSNWERKGPLSPAVTSGPAGRDMERPRTQDGPRDRKNSPAWGEGRSQDGSRPPKREFQERVPVDRAPTAPEMDNQWRAKMKPDAPAAKSPTPSSHEISSPPSPAAPPAPAVRPKLNLQKRTVSEADPTQSPASATSDAKASPFGAARPIDTSTREKEIEEKRQLALRQKKEHDEKMREERRLVKEAEKAERAEKVEKTEKAGKAAPKEQESEKKENGVDGPPAGKNYEILRKAAQEESTAGDEEADAGGDNNPITDDKAIKPKEIIQDIPAKSAEGAWRGNGNNKASEAATESSADTLEEDGWSTVSKPRNNRRGGNQAARAIAS